MPMVHWYLGGNLFCLSLTLSLLLGALRLSNFTHKHTLSPSLVNFFHLFRMNMNQIFFRRHRRRRRCRRSRRPMNGTHTRTSRKKTTTTNNHYTKFKYSFSRSNSDRKSAFFLVFWPNVYSICTSNFQLLFFLLLLLLNQTSNCNAEQKKIYNFTSKIYNVWKLQC